jgi:hypothetical protein
LRRFSSIHHTALSESFLLIVCVREREKELDGHELFNMSSLFFHPLLPRAAATKLMECSPRVRQTAKLGNIHYAALFEIQELQKKTS